MWVEIVDGQVGQQVDDSASVTTAAGTQYPWNFPKAEIPNLVNVAMAATPDPAQFIVTGYTINFANGTATQVLETTPVALQTMQTAQQAVLTAACAAAIVGGYRSSALGAAHTYPSALTDQINMMASVAASLLPGLEAGWTTVFWCEDANGGWARLPHTAAQIQQVGSDGKTWVTNCQNQLVTLSSQVLAATTETALKAIIWQNPS